LALYLEISDKTGKNDAKYFAEKIIKENATLISCDDEVSNWMATLSLNYFQVILSLYFCSSSFIGLYSSYTKI
jgi:hypothetical protein